VNFKDDEIKELLETSEFGDAMMMSEASRDIEAVLDGELPRPNRGATLAYKQRFVDYMNDHEDDMTHEQFMQLAAYIQSCEPFVMANTVRAINAKAANQALETPTPTPNGAPPAPTPNGAVPLSTSPDANGSVPVSY
jgi:hypothetical protein